MQRYLSVTALLMLLLMFSIASFGQTATTTPQSSTPSAQVPSTGQSGSPGAMQQNQSRPQAGSIDDELQLTPDQKQKIAAVIDDEKKQMGAVRDNASMPMDQKQQKAAQIRQDGAVKIRAVLTPEQLQKLAALQEKARQQQNSSPNSPH